jgi:PKD repeat protein
MKKIKKLLLFLSILITPILTFADFSANVTQGCAPVMVTFNETSGNGVNWEWDFGDGSTTIYNNPANHQYNTAGVYTVTLTVRYSDGSSEVITKTNYIRISTGPTVSFIANYTSVCPGEVVTFTPTVNPGGNNIGSYFWDFGDGNISSTATPTHIYYTSGTRSVSLEVVDTMGCKTKVSNTNYIFIKPTPVANFTSTTNVFCIEDLSQTRQVTFSDSSDTSAISYYWDFGDGTNSSQKNPPAKTYSRGNYDITLIVTNAYGCKDTIIKSKYVMVGLFEATYTLSDSVLCGLGKSVIISGTSNAQYKFETYNSGGAMVHQQLGSNKSYTFTNPGKYDIKSMATSTLGCADTLYKSQAIWVFDDVDPVIYIHDTDHCEPTAIIYFQNFTITDSIYDLGLSDASWDFGDGSTNVTGDSVTHVYNSFGSWEVRVWVTTGYGCVLEVYKQQVDIYPISAIAYQVVPNVMMGEKPGGCLPHFVAMYADSIKSSSQVIDFIWDWGETEVWGSGAAPDTTHTGTSPLGTYTYDYDTGVYIVNLILTNQQGCHDTVEAFARIPVGYPPLCDWFFANNMLCKSALSITVTAYDSLNPVDSSLVARSRANHWEWYDPMGNFHTQGNPANLSPTDTGWLHGYSLIPYHNDCPGPQVAHDSVMYSCPPMAGIGYPAPDMQGNPPNYCEWPTFGFDGGDGQKTKAWDSCVWRLGNFYYDMSNVFHPQMEIHPDADHPQGHISYGPPHSPIRYDTLGGMKMVVERGGHIFVTLWVMNDNRNGNNLCGYCEDSAQQEIIISIADMKLRATDQYGNVVTEVCEDQQIYFYDSTYATDGIYWWAMSMDRAYDGGVIHYTTEDLMGRIQSGFGHPNKSKFIFDTTNYTGSDPFIYEFNDWGIYTIYLIDTSAIGCGMNGPMAPPFIEWQSTMGPRPPYEGRTDTIQLYVNPRSVPKFSTNSPVCIGDTLQFTDESYTGAPFTYYTITNYLWNTGGSTDTAKNAKYVFKNAGQYDVTLSVRNEKGCDSTEKFQKAITIMGVKTTFSTPKLDPNDRRVCNKEVVNFSNTSSYYDLVRNTMVSVSNNTTGLTYLWDFDGQGTSNSRNGQFAFNVLNSRYVYIRLTITDMNGCTNSFLDSIWVIRPIADFTSGTHVQACPELQVQFFDQSSGMDSTKTKYEWVFGDTLSLGNNTSSFKNPFHNYAYAGNFDVTLIVTDEYNCTDTMLKPKYVKVGGPYGTFTIDTTSGCVPLRVTFNFDIDISNTDTLWLYYGDGTNDTTTFIGAPVKHIYTQPGYYVPWMYLIKWVFNPVTNQMEKCEKGFPLADTIWVIQLKPDFGIEPLYCKGVPSTFTNFTDTTHNNILPKVISLDTVWWDYNNTLYDTIFDIKDTTDIDGHTQYDSAGFYLVTLKAQIKSCIKKDTATIKVMEFPNIKSSPDSVGACVGLDVILTADSTNGEETNFSWAFFTIPDTLSGNPITRYFNEVGTVLYPFEIDVTFSPKNCHKIYNDTLIVSSWTPPTAEFKIEDADGLVLTDAVNGINAGNDAYFSDMSTPGHGVINKWIWIFGDDYIDTTGPNVKHAYTTKSGFITVTLGISDEYGCSDTTTHQILVLESLKFPNIFSPNGDGINDKFEPWERQKSGYFLKFEMEIYNKWGALVWKRKCESPNCPNYDDENFWWDGKNNNGNNVPDGVYYWVVYARPESEKGDIIINGSVTIVR